MQNESSENAALATTCMAAGAACCRAGKVLLSPSEYDDLAAYVASRSAAERAEFDGRCEEHDGFRLYDQREGCQFLTEDALCRVHPLGIKPKECFWWPLHVYETAEGSLEIRSASYCCRAASSLSQDGTHVDLIAEQAAELGHDVLRKFRKVFPGNYSEKQRVRVLDPGTNSA